MRLNGFLVGVLLFCATASHAAPNKNVVITQEQSEVKLQPFAGMLGSGLDIGSPTAYLLLGVGLAGVVIGRRRVLR